MVRLTVRLLAMAKKNMQAQMEYYSKFSPSPLSIKQFMDFGQSKDVDSAKSFVFLRQELPVRIANIMKEINLLPEKLLQMPSVRMVQGWYQQTFEELLEYVEKTEEEDPVLLRYINQLTTIRNRHVNVVETMAQGILEMRESYKVDQHEENNVQYFLDRFYISRISIRMLINQHTLMFGQIPTTHPLLVGSIDPSCDIVAVIRDAYDSAKYLCDQYYLASPDIDVRWIDARDGSDSIRMVYVPSHLYHIMFELLKNAMRAVMEHKGPSASEFPPIGILVTKGKEDVTIKVSDEGGGIPKSEIDLLFNYMYSTAPAPPKPGVSIIPPLAGYGYGLPISRLYAKYFHGDLTLSSMDGYGTDAVVYLKVLSSEASELLPIYNSAVSRYYKTPTPASDWSTPGYFIRNYTTKRYGK
ncbi:pyruvate dehydrogenase (acetyl-transferring) kinase isozyme 2, mitochondrial [Strongylocentrotus purpuratus]|uniref:Protein-serine/threonine kinase n=1 Tax=Strongylocentrotus purpuratus TaxID=7668 RepID=A0A7M7RI02_STRPU|nr:pyruvate dehydrogenase (acetyl-transferring) kinase isozyme 2, mitochondrial [Strongylocentrotus purpuratus]|eukprot:XP_792733.3 PREDICTED: pyruvate dehydrogenase (acetyl-transferring) kinase isozyme 2, mitochondrial [Strongylocentrotus purpuratus]